MRKSEIEPVQLRLGEKVIIREFTRGIIGKDASVIVPTKKGYCYATLDTEELEVERHGVPEKIRNKTWISLKTLESFTVRRTKEGITVRWPLPIETYIKARPKELEKRKKVVEIIFDKKNLPFL
jgi:hypothetical protein